MLKGKAIVKCAIYIIAACGLIFTSCRHREQQINEEDDDSLFTEIPALDTASPIQTDTVNLDELKPIADSYSGSIIPVIEEASQNYGNRIRTEGKDGFIVVDKGRMKVILYDGDGFAVKSYGMACAKNYGNKQKKADSRTPEGFFHVQGVYDSTDWLFTDDNGKTSKKKGQYGPRFIRIAPQIGIHGTCSPWSIGHRTSHGCIRITNENIMELHELVHVGMPVIVIPGTRDRKVNREEGNESVYFPTKGDPIKLPDEPRKVDTVQDASHDIDTVAAESENPEVTAPAAEETVPETVPETAPVIPEQEETVPDTENYF